MTKFTMNSSEVKKLIYSLSELERRVLPFLLSTTSLEEVANNSSMELHEVTTAIQLLEQREITTFIKKEISSIELDKFGFEYVGTDLPEIQVLKLLKEKSQAMNEIPKELIGSAMGELKKNKLIESVKKDNGIMLSINDKGLEYLQNNSENPLREFNEKIEVSKLSETQKEILLKFKQRKGFLRESITKVFSFSLT
ncbi:MAG: hypothetical protein VXZ40_02720, partial [Nanoarchaeota archaeon]|nr:hypothetical protein [Nanoarchaeota archaeon]